MPKISFKKNFVAAEVGQGTTLMRALLDAGRPVGSSCGGEGVCTKCLIEISEGATNLSPENNVETKLRSQHGIDKKYRVSCQTKILGDVCVDADYW